jgi:hypothetical protein
VEKLEQNDAVCCKGENDCPSSLAAGPLERMEQDELYCNEKVHVLVCFAGIDLLPDLLDIPDPAVVPVQYNGL